MAWVPVKQVIDTSQFISNIFAFIQANQADALLWAKGDNSLTPIQKFFPRSNGIVNTKFPSLIVLDKAVDDDLGDHLSGAFSIVFMIFLQGGNADAVAASADYYIEALRSMLSNLPGDPTGEITLQKNSKIQMTAEIHSFESEFDELLKAANGAYLQAFRIKAVWTLTASPERVN